MSRKRRDAELDEEVNAHLRMAEADRVARGESAADAAANARREFGSVAHVKEITREIWGGMWLERGIQDIAFGLRMLRRTPGFSIFAVLCLAIGIGATTAVFSWIEGILLRPFPLVAHQERMVALSGFDRNGRTDVSWPDLQDLRRSSTLFESFIAEHITGVTLAVGDRAERAVGSVVSSNYFQALGIRPTLGRTFDPSEDVGDGAHPVAVISYRWWQDRFRGDPDIIGKTQRLDGVPHSIIGVMPRGFFGTFVGYQWQFWVPASMESLFDGGGYKLENRGGRWIEGFAFMKPGVTVAQAQAEISAIGKRLEGDYTEIDRGRGFRIDPLWQTPFNRAGNLLPTLRISLVVACLLLFIACANVGNLLLVRSFARRHEMNVRLSLGARRGRLVRQLLTESLILSIAGAAGGFLLAYWCRDLLKVLFPPLPAGMIANLPSRMDLRVLALAAGVCIVATLLFGLAPAFQASKIDVATAMKSESGGVVGGGRTKARIRSILVLVQVSLGFILLVGAGLLLKSLRAMRETEPGFSTEVLTTYVDMGSAGYDTTRIRTFQDRLVERIGALPGVQAVVWVRSVPFTYRPYGSAPVSVDGFVPEAGEQQVVEYNEVGPSYFATMGIPLVSGRDFQVGDNETAEAVAVVNEAMAQRFWRGQDPVGKRLEVKGRALRVVGIARNSNQQTLRQPPQPLFYTPLRQGSSPGQNLQIRTTLGPQRLSNALVREVKAIDANLAPGEVITMKEVIARKNWSQRAAVSLIAVFGSVALLLAAIGLYGVMSYSVSQSSRELGLRMALGARASHLLRMVLSYGLRLMLAGIALGAGVALGTTRLMGDLLYKVSPRDPEPFV
ncbi:MAG TPA: ABC transporter permease, partial [Thermoanaerobaculia bacterium]